MSTPRKPLASAVVEGQSAYVQHIRTGNHQLTADEPTERGGTDAGPAPYDLLLSALGACSAITLRMYADRKGWVLGTIHVELDHYKEHDGSEHIERRLRFSAPLTDEQVAKLLEIVEKTPVTKTIKAGAPITTTLAKAT